MTCEIQDFRNRFPEFSDPVEYSEDRIQLFLDDAVLIMGTREARWCNQYNRAHCYLTAHLLVVGTKTETGDTSATVGPISQKRAGGVSVTRSVTTKDRSDADDQYASTAYGLTWLSIRDSCIPGVVVAV